MEMEVRQTGEEVLVPSEVSLITVHDVIPIMPQ